MGTRLSWRRAIVGGSGCVSDRRERESSETPRSDKGKSWCPVNLPTLARRSVCADVRHVLARVPFPDENPAPVAFCRRFRHCIIRGCAARSLPRTPRLTTRSFSSRFTPCRRLAGIRPATPPRNGSAARFPWTMLMVSKWKPPAGRAELLFRGDLPRLPENDRRAVAPRLAAGGRPDFRGFADQRPTRRRRGLGAVERQRPRNGPAVFYEMRLGRNFSDFSQAQPGDFMKIFWSNAVGRKEHGHSVIFLGMENGQRGGERQILVE